MSENVAMDLSGTMKETASLPTWRPLACICPCRNELVLREDGLNLIRNEMNSRKASTGAFFSVIGEDTKEDNVVGRLVKAWFTGCPEPVTTSGKSTCSSEYYHRRNNETSTTSVAVPISAEEENSVWVWSRASIHGLTNKVAVFLIKISRGRIEPELYTKLTDFCLLLSSRTIVPIIRSNEQQSSMYNLEQSVIPASNFKIFQLHFIVIDPQVSSSSTTSKVLSEQEFLNMIQKMERSLTWEQFSSLREYSHHSVFFSLVAPILEEIWTYFRATLELEDMQKEDFSKFWPQLFENMTTVSQLVNTVGQEDVPMPLALSENTQVLNFSNEMRDEYMLLLQCLKSGWIKAKLQNDSIMNLEFNILMRKFLKEFKSKVGDGPYRHQLENVLMAAFENEFLTFKSEYCKIQVETSQREMFIEQNLRDIEEEFRQNWYCGDMDSFFNQLNARYLTLISQFDNSVTDNLLMTNLQLHVATRYAEHEKEIRNAREMLDAIDVSMTERFKKHAEDPTINKIPSRPEIPNILANNPRDAVYIKDLLENCIGGSYQAMLEVLQEMNQERQVIPWTDLSKYGGKSFY